MTALYKTTFQLSPSYWLHKLCLPRELKDEQADASLSTLNSAYNEKKYAEILLHYRWLFVKADVFKGE